jgi:hypothetical protein
VASPFQGFAKRVLASGLAAELLNLLPRPAREALVDVREYLAEHGRLPKFTLFERAPAGSVPKHALNAFLGPLNGGERLSMVNLFRGALAGGELRSSNVAAGDVGSGTVHGVNALCGDVHGGVVERVNVLLGNVHGGEVRLVNVLHGDVYGGRVQCHLLIGDVHGGEVQATHHRGRALGGRALCESTRGE